MATYGYIRVSSADQNEDRQTIAMNELAIPPEPCRVLWTVLELSFLGLFFGQHLQCTINFLRRCRSTE
jgi:hypothetical protein